MLVAFFLRVGGQENEEVNRNVTDRGQHDVCWCPLWSWCRNRRSCAGRSGAWPRLCLEQRCLDRAAFRGRLLGRPTVLRWTVRRRVLGWTACGPRLWLCSRISPVG